MAPVVVRAPGGLNADHLVLVVPERQVLANFPNDQFAWHSRILFYRFSGSRWIVGTPTHSVEQSDLGMEQIQPVVAGALYPVEGRPTFAFGSPTAVELDLLRGRASGLADILGVDITAIGLTTGSVSNCRFADPSHPNFGQEVPAALVTNPLSFEARAGCGLVLHDASDGHGPAWTFAERLLATDLPAWQEEKRNGAGRDPRIAGPSRKAREVRTLYRNAILDSDRTAPAMVRLATNLNSSSSHELVMPPPDTDLFGGSSVLKELNQAIMETGFEIPQYAANLLGNSGINSRATLAIEVNVHFLSLHLLATLDGLNGYRLNVAEHIARRTTMCLKAIARNPKSPDFCSLDSYLRHMADPTSGLRTGPFDRYVASEQKVEAQILKQTRLTREEEEAETRRSKSNPGEPAQAQVGKADAKAKGGDG